MSDLSSSQQLPERGVRRSFNGYLAPIAIAALGAALPVLIETQRQHVAEARAAEKPHWVTNCDGSHTLVRPLPPPERAPAWATFGIAGMLALFGVGTELGVRKQLDLARNGLEAEAIIDEVVKVRGGRSEHHRASWSFIAADNKLYHGRCTISEIDASVLQTGSRLTVFYDADDPTKNRIENALWAVEWDSPGAA